MGTRWIGHNLKNKRNDHPKASAWKVVGQRGLDTLQIDEVKLSPSSDCIVIRWDKEAGNGAPGSKLGRASALTVEIRGSKLLLGPWWWGVGSDVT